MSFFTSVFKSDHVLPLNVSSAYDIIVPFFYSKNITSVICEENRA